MNIEWTNMNILKKLKKKSSFFLNPRAKNAGLDLGILASGAPLNPLRGGKNHEKVYWPGVTHHGQDTP